jgi:hypothetical protein
VARDAARAVQRGEAAATIEDAKQALSLARARHKALRSRSTYLVPVVLTLAPLAVVVSDVIHARFAFFDVVLIALAVLSAAQAVCVPSQRRAAARAESANRAFLLDAGVSPADVEPDFPSPTRTQVAADSLVRFGLYCALFGGVVSALDGEPLSAANMWDRGWLFAAFATAISGFLFEREQRR